MNVCVIIPAAGRSDRFGTADKLAQDLGGRPLLMRTVELFTKREEVNSILVAAPPDSRRGTDRFGREDWPRFWEESRGVGRRRSSRGVFRRR